MSSPPHDRPSEGRDNLPNEPAPQEGQSAEEPARLDAEWLNLERELLADDVPEVGVAGRSPQTPSQASPAYSATIHSFDPFSPLVMVETAFLTSAASLIWLVDYYFPTGPLLRIFFPVPIALIYLRWGNRAAWMGALVSGLLLAVLMGPARSIMFVMPYGLLSVLLGVLWHRRASWCVSIGIGTVLGSFGLFFRLWLLSLLLGDDLWLYVTTQVTGILEWIFVKLGLVLQPSLAVVQAIAVGMIILNSLVYLFVVHLVALFLLDRLGNPIPRPPKWVEVLIEYEE